MKLPVVAARIRRAAARFRPGRADPSLPSSSTSMFPHASPPAFPGAGREPGLAFLFTLLLIAVCAISYSPHVGIYRDFQDLSPEIYLAGDVPTVSADSYYWLRAARDVRDGSWQVGEVDRLRAFPDGIRRGDPPSLARIIALIADWTGRDVYHSSQLFALITSCLFVVPLGVYALRIGHPAAGLLAAGFAASSHVVFARTAVYNIDTDALNLFGLWSITLAISCVPLLKTFGRQAFLTLVAALATSLFIEWYERELFYVVFCAVFPICLLTGRVSRGTVVVLALLFAIGANPLNLKPSVANFGQAADLYVSGWLDDFSSSEDDRIPEDVREEVGPIRASPMNISQNDLMSFIAEGRRLPVERSLSLIGEPGWLVAIELSVFLIWSVAHWRLAAPLAPIFMLGLMGILVANRFLIFLAPLAGLGLGLLYSYLARWVAVRMGHGARAARLACVIALPILALPLFASRPEWAGERPFSADYIRSLQQASRHVPAGSPVWSTWGHGYLIQDVMGAATFRDGLPDLEVGHFYLKSLTGDDPQRLYRTIAYLQSHSQQDVRRRFWADYAGLDEEISAFSGQIERSTFLLMNEDSFNFFEGEFQLGQWSPGDGWPSGSPIVRFYCQTRRGSRLQCGEPGAAPNVFDLSSGTIDGSPRFGHVVISRSGFKTSERRTRSSKPQLLEVISESNGSISVYPMKRDAYSSLVNQLYALGKLDERYLELVYDDFPRVRLYRFRTVGE